MVDNKDLLRRTKIFSEKIIELSFKFARNPANQILVKQVVRAATSVGANYREACEAESSKDFVHKIKLSKKEARESEYWLLLLFKANPKLSQQLKPLISESNQLVRIFSTIAKKFRKD